MAKISFTKLGLKPNNTTATFDFNAQIIEVKQYLPVEEKLEIITNVLELSHDENNFSNPVKVQVYTALQIVEKYTNINFTDKQKENVVKLYDILSGNGLIEKVIENIPQEEYNVLIQGICDTIDAVYKYQNSILGILNAISTDYSNLKLDAEEVQNQLKDPASFSLVRDIVTRLG